MASDNVPFSLQMPNSLRRETRQSRTRHSLPDLFESLNYQARPDIAPVRIKYFNLRTGEVLLSGSEHPRRLRDVPVSCGEQHQHSNYIPPATSSPGTFLLLPLGLTDQQGGGDSQDAAETLPAGNTDLGSSSQAQCKFNHHQYNFEISLKRNQPIYFTSILL